MNANTRLALVNLINAIETLANGVILTTGTTTTSEVMTACELAKIALENDETII